MRYKLDVDHTSVVSAAQYAHEQALGGVTYEFNGFPENIVGKYYISTNNELKELPPKTLAYSAWDVEQEEWRVDLSKIAEAKLFDLEREISKRLVAVIEFEDSLFDADRISRERITGTIARIQRGDGLPAGWVGWRDAQNQMHWAAIGAPIVLSHLTGLSRAIEDREQAILLAAWAHKKAIADFAEENNIDELANYDVTQGWPE